MSFSLLGVHVNGMLGGLAEAIGAWKPPVVVALDHSSIWQQVKAESPDTVFVGRIYQAHEPDFNLSLAPLPAARAHCEVVLPFAERMGKTYQYWQGVNEPVVSSKEAMARYADFEAERARVMHSHGFRVVVGSFSVGNPAHMALWKQFQPALEAALQFQGALALHEYGWPSLEHESPWYLLRHRKVYHGEPKEGWQGFPAHLKALPLLITECGLDGGIEPGYGARGWRVRYSGEDYLRQLAWYSAELRKDPYVAGAALYCCCSPDDPLWKSFNVWPDVVGVLGQQSRPIYRLKPRPKPAPPKPSPTPPPERKGEPEPQEPAEPEPSPPPTEGPTAPGSQPRRLWPMPRGSGDDRPIPISRPQPSAIQDVQANTPQPPQEAVLTQAVDGLDRVAELLAQRLDRHPTGRPGATGSGVDPGTRSARTVDEEWEALFDRLDQILDMLDEEDEE